MAEPSPSTGSGASGELERYRFLFHASPDAITFARWSDGVLLDVNPGFERMSGYSRDEAVGKTALELGLWANGAQREAYIRHLCSDGRFQGFPALFRAKDGSLCHVELVANVARFGEEAVIISMIRDCTGRRQAETELTAILNNASVGILFSRNRLIERCNRRLAEIYGCEVEDLVGKPASVFYTDDESYARMGREAGPLLSSGKAFRSDWLFRKADGSTLWCNVYARAVDPSDSSMGTVWVLEDITEARRTEKLLAQIVQGSSVATFVIDREHRVTHWNKALEVLSGLDAREVMGTDGHWRAFYRKERPCLADLVVDGGTVESLKLHYRERGRPSAQLEGAFEAESFFPDMKPHGKWLYFTAAPLFDEDGVLIGAIETLQDVSERKFAEIALQQQNNVFKTIVDNMPGGVILSDAQLRVIACNDTYKRMLDIDESLFADGEPMLQDILRSMIARGEFGEGDPEVLLETLMHRIYQDQPQQYERVRPNGMVIEVRCSPLPRGGYILNVFDITERKRNEEQLRASQAARDAAELASRAKSEFLAVMSHEIRTPLAGVIGMLKFALDDPLLQQRTREHVRIGLDNAQSLLAIINDILDFSKIEAGKLTLETVDFDLPALVKEAVDPMRELAAAKGIELKVELDGALPRYLRGDPVRIRQILLNLTGNAVKFTERGSVRLLTRPAGKRQDAETIEFVVSDTGPGIEPEAVARLFRKFEQADLSTTRRYGGTGLGLAICKELVEMMGGQIGVDSWPGAGSVFRFHVPLAYGTRPAPHAASGALARHTHRLRVLCAEDGPTNQIIVRTLVENMGHEVTIVEDGMEAVLALARRDFDLVLMDGRMPRMDGEDAARTIRAGGLPAAPVRNARVPIVALTANAAQEDRERYLAAGMDGFLSKPVDDAALYGEIERTIAQLLRQGYALPPMQQAEPPPAASRIVPGNGLAVEALERIVAVFLRDAPHRLHAAREALRGGNGKGVAMEMHSLKGSAGYLGLKELQAMCGQFEQMANAGDLAMVAERMERLQRVLDEGMETLQAKQSA